jgi:hypothetical protein
MKTQTIISAMTIFTIAIAITAYAHDHGGGPRGDYGMGKNNYAMMGGRGMMGGNGSGSGMMHDSGQGDQGRYNRDTTDNNRRNHRDYRYNRDSSDHYRQGSEYDRYNRNTEDDDRWNQENNRKNDPNSREDIESFKDQSR